jgi:hypothetical protein
MDIEFDCPQMQKIKTEMKYLSGSVDEKDRKIRDLKAKVEKRNLRVKGLTKGWGHWQITCSDLHMIKLCF